MSSQRPRTPFEALSNEAQKRLRELMATLDPLGKLATRGRARGASAPAPSHAEAPRRDLRVPKSGDVLSRRYKGRQITVRVLESGFEYEGRRFRSLSAVAQAVTGAHWNGLLFFGSALRNPRGRGAHQRVNPRGELMDDRQSNGAASS